MLGRKHRFHGYNSVLPVYRQAKTVRADGCSLHYKLNPRRRDYRLSVVVSKKVAKSAVQRNRMRRRVYETVRTNIKIDQPYDLIVTIFDADFANRPYAELVKIISNLFEKSGVDSR
jgi:ribonuclease P protein component